MTYNKKENNLPNDILQIYHYYFNKTGTIYIILVIL